MRHQIYSKTAATGHKTSDIRNMTSDIRHETYSET